MKITAFLTAVTLSAGALAQQPTNPPSSATPGATTPGITTPGAPDPITGTPPATVPSNPGTTTAPGLTNPDPGQKIGATAPWPTFESLDKNADARISSSEAAASVSLSGKFSALDKTGKGYLTREEYQAAMPAGLPRGERSSSDTN